MDHVELLRHLISDASDGVSVVSLMARAHLDHLQTTTVLRDLESAGVASWSDGRVQYRPSAANERAIGMLLEAYNARPVTLVRAIYARQRPRPSLRDVLDVPGDE